MDREQPPRINPLLFYTVILTLMCTSFAVLAEPALMITIVDHLRAIFHRAP
jgi:hypothetical protein